MTYSIEKTPAGNNTCPKGGGSCSKNSFVGNQTLVFQMNICAKKPAHRKSANRYENNNCSPNSIQNKNKMGNQTHAQRNPI